MTNWHKQVEIKQVKLKIASGNVDQMIVSGSETERDNLENQGVIILERTWQ